MGAGTGRHTKGQRGCKLDASHGFKQFLRSHVQFVTSSHVRQCNVGETLLGWSVGIVINEVSGLTLLCWYLVRNYENGRPSQNPFQVREKYHTIDDAPRISQSAVGGNGLLIDVERSRCTVTSSLCPDTQQNTNLGDTVHVQPKAMQAVKRTCVACEQTMSV